MQIKVKLVFFLLISLPVLGRANDHIRALTEALREEMKQTRELGEQVRRLSARVSELEARLARANQKELASYTVDVPIIRGTSPVAVSPPDAKASSIPKSEAPAVIAGSLAGSYKVPGTDTSLALGGFVKLDAIYSSISAGNGNSGNHWLALNSIPVGSDRHERHGQTALHARESRLWLKSLTPTNLGDLTAYVEVDFFDTSNSTTGNYNPRLRHAFGTLGNFIAGQTWSSFTNIETYPETLDFSSKMGSSFLRTPLVGWIQPFKLDGVPMKWQLSAEMPQTNFTLRNETGVSTRREDGGHMPDMAARLTYTPDWGILSLAGLFRQLRAVGLDNRVHETWSGGGSLAGKFRVTGLDNIRFNLNYGDAIGRYATGLVIDDAALSTSGEWEAITTLSGFIGYQHWWSPDWRSNLVYNYIRADQPDFLPNAVTQAGQSVHADLIWNPLRETMLGLEYIYAVRELADGRTGDLHRVQFSTRFSF